jgi:hypothetical protein
MVDAFLRLVLDVFGLASIESAVPGVGFRFRGPHFRGRPASDLLFFAKHLFVASTSAYAAVITLVQLTPPAYGPSQPRC